MKLKEGHRSFVSIGNGLSTADLKEQDSRLRHPSTGQ
jgi:hypothetical protein